MVYFNDVKPFIENGRTLVPMRAIFEEYYCNVEWDSGTKTVTASTEWLFNIQLTIGKKQAITYFWSIDDNGSLYKDNIKVINLDVAPKIYNGRTMVPLRFISESMNDKVEWDDSNRNIYIGDCTNVKAQIKEKNEKGNLIKYFGNTKNEIAKNFGNPDQNDYYRGAEYYLYQSKKLMFFFNYYNNTVCTICTYSNEDCGFGISGNMTYDEIISKLGNKVNIPKPQFVNDELEGEQYYSSEFLYQGKRCEFIWDEYSNPNKDKSDMLYIYLE